MRFNKLSSKGRTKTVDGVYKHNRRLQPVENADSDKSVLNEELIQCDANKSYQELINERLEKLGYSIKDNELYDPEGKKVRSDAVNAVEFLFTFSPEELSNIDINTWKTDCINWLREQMNSDIDKYGDNVLSATLHLDEKTPHIHAIVIPIDEKGHLNCFHYIQGKSSLSDMQTNYSEYIKGHGHNLDRGIKYSTSKHIPMKKLRGKTMAEFEKIPAIEKNDTMESYKEKIEAYVSEEISKCISYKKEADIDANKKIAAEIASRQKEHKELKQIKKQMEGMEREFGPYDECIKKLESMEALIEAINSYPDENEAEHAREIMNKMIALGVKNRLKRNKKKEIENPVK